MQISDKVIQQIQTLAYDPYATCSYEMMSGGLIWSDEITNDLMIEMMRSDFIGTFRFLLGYRSSLIMGKEREEFRAVWEETMPVLPNWPFFREDRRSHALRPILLQLEERETRCIGILLKRYGLEDDS